MTRRVLTVVIALLIVMTAGARAEAAVPQGFVGIVSDDVFAHTVAYRDKTLATQQRVGVTLMRMTFDWSLIEKRRGQYDFAYYDDAVITAAAHGIQILPVLFNPPKFLSSRPRRHAAPGTYYPRHLADFGAFAAAVARRYGPTGTLWGGPGTARVPITAYQLWNEPNLAVYSPPKPSAARYVALLRAGADGIRAVYPGAEIVSAGMPDSRLSRPRLYTFLAQMYKAGARGVFNTLAINPYSRTASGVLRILTKVRQVMHRYNDDGAQLWATEMGWSDRGPRSDYRVGPKAQAQRITQTIAALAGARARLNLRGFIYYSWRDGHPYPPRFKDFWGLHTGLLRRNGTAKPAMAAFKRAVAAITG
jgi:hypothetical protein